MTLYVNILTNKSGQQTTLNLVPTLSRSQVTTAKQAYLFGGPLLLHAGNHEAHLATADSGVSTYVGGRATAGRVAAEPSLKDPWPASASAGVVIPSSLLPSPFSATTFAQNIDNATRATSGSYTLTCVRDLSPSSSTATLDLTGLPAFVWHGHISLVGSSPLVIVTRDPFSLSDFGASSSTVDVTPVSTSRGASTAALPYPDFDMLVAPFEQVRSLRLASA